MKTLKPIPSEDRAKIKSKLIYIQQLATDCRDLFLYDEQTLMEDNWGELCSEVEITKELLRG